MAAAPRGNCTAIALRKKVDLYMETCGKRRSPPQITELATYLGITRFALARRFRAKVGVRLLTYINRWRMAKAKKLLQKTALPMPEVARQAGFGTERSLDRIFKKVMGKTPSTFRRDALVRSSAPPFS